MGAFCGSICRVLNDAVSYPAFSKSKVVEDTVRKFVDTAIEERILWLTQQYSETFIDHAKFMDYGESELSDEEENLVMDEDRISDDRYERMNNQLLDSLIHLDKIHEAEAQRKPALAENPVLVHTSSQEMETLATHVDGRSATFVEADIADNDGGKRKKRKHKLEKPREKKLTLPFSCKSSKAP